MNSKQTIIFLIMIIISFIFLFNNLFLGLISIIISFLIGNIFKISNNIKRHDIETQIYNDMKKNKIDK